MRKPPCRAGRKTVVVKVATGLTRREAQLKGWPKAKKLGKCDYRGFTYNARTGKATYT